MICGTTNTCDILKVTKSPIKVVREMSTPACDWRDLHLPYLLRVSSRALGPRFAKYEENERAELAR